MRMFGRPSKHSERLAEDERADLERQVARGRLADEFLRGKFWLEHLEIHLKVDDRICLEKACWKPGSNPDPHAIAMQNAFNSGMRMQIEKLRNDLKSWYAIGEAAQRKLLENAKAVAAEGVTA